MSGIVDEFPEGKVKEQLLKNQQALKINRVPKHIKQIFIKTAEDKYCNDYGMLLTVLVEKYLKEEENK